MHLKFKIAPERIRNLLVIIAIVIAIVSLISEYLVEIVFAAQYDGILSYILDLFSVNLEESIPTWYSVLILATAAILLFLIARAKSNQDDAHSIYWWGLAFIITYFSMDEGAVIHEIFASPLQEAFNTNGFLAFGWQIIAFPLVVIFGLVYLRFLLQLPLKTRNWFIVGAILYAGGALIIEGFSAGQYESAGITMTYLSLATLEEFCEIFGVSLFIYALLDYIQQHAYSLEISTGVGSIEAVPQLNFTEKPQNIRKDVPVLYRPVTWIIILLIATNFASLGWILANRSVDYIYTLPQFYEPLLAELESDGVTIVEVPDLFGITNTHSLETVHLLSETNSEIYVVVFPSNQRSVILAGNNLSFDRDTLTEWLHSNGQVEFIIFDPLAVDAIIGN